MSRIILLLLPAALACAQILTWDEYRAVASRDPGVLRLQSGDGQLLYFGVRHTRDPNDPQIEEIARHWREFRPTLALTEGGVPPAADSAREAVLRYGEAGLVRFLAVRDRADRVKLFYFLRAIADVRRHPPPSESLVEFAETELVRLSRNPGLHGAPRTLREVASAVPGPRAQPVSQSPHGETPDRASRRP